MVTVSTQSGGQGDVAIPQFLHMQKHRLAVDSYVREMSSGSDDALADLERRGGDPRLQ